MLRFLRAHPALSAALLVALGFVAHRANFGYGILGFDSYKQIIAARILDANDLAGTFTEPLADGRIEARFYRPVQNLSIALDYALGGLAPLGYQVSTMLAYALCIVAMFTLLRRVLGPDAWLGPFAATLFWTLHPALLNVLPTPCRRSDLSVTALLCLALVVLPVERAKPRRSWIAAAFVLLAAGAKDIGVMGVGLIWIHQAWFSPGSSSEKVRAATRACLPALVLAGVYLAARTFALGGFGGYVHHEEVAGGYFGRLSGYGAGLMRDLLCPAPVWGAGARATALGLAAALLAAGVVLLVSRARPRASGVFLLGLAWLLPPVLTLGWMNWYGPWYAVHPTAGVAFVLAAILHASARTLAGSGTRRWVGAGGALVAAAALVAGLFFSPLHTPYPEWGAASAELEETLSALDRKIERTDPGGRVTLQVEPYYRGPKKRRGPQLEWVAVIFQGGVQAYAKMRHPDVRVRVALARSEQAQRQDEDEILVVLRFEGALRP